MFVYFMFQRIKHRVKGICVTYTSLVILYEKENKVNSFIFNVINCIIKCNHIFHYMCRTPGTGLYDNLQQYKIPEPAAIFDLDYFWYDPRPFFCLAQSLYPGNYQPNYVHHFVKLLHDKGLLLRMYTQNIDGLERCKLIEFFNYSFSMSDQDRISPYNINTPGSLWFASTCNPQAAKAVF